jgi:hypothetical protein
MLTHASQGSRGERVVMSDEASELVGRRIVSRLIEMCGDPLALWGVDKRQELPLPGSPRRSVAEGRLRGN